MSGEARLTDADQWWRAYEEQQVRDIAYEHELTARVIAAAEAFAAIVAERHGCAWNWGNGEGGWALETIQSALEARGLLPPRLVGPPTTSAREVFERDAYRCVACRGWHDLTVDHIMPSSRGGSDDPANLQTLCRRCNSSKGARTMDEWEGVR